MKQMTKLTEMSPLLWQAHGGARLRQQKISQIVDARFDVCWGHSLEHEVMRFLNHLLDDTLFLGA